MRSHIENSNSKNQSSDQLNELGVLNRREIEARILGPMLHALGDEFGRERVLEVARRVVIEIARQTRFAGFCCLAGKLEERRRSGDRGFGTKRDQVFVQRAALPLCRDVPGSRHPRARRAAFMQPRRSPDRGFQP
jgi:hypothetical protein